MAVGALPLWGTGVTGCPGQFCPIREQGATRHKQWPPEARFLLHLRRTWSPCLDHGSLTGAQLSLTHTTRRILNRDLCLPRSWEIWETAGGEDGEGNSFFLGGIWQDISPLRKRYRGLVLDWWVSRSLAVQISFPWTTHLLLKSVKALAFLLSSPITPGGHVLFLLRQWECGYCLY